MAVATLGSQLRVFLCHATEDKPMIRQLYDDLYGADVEPWLDEKCLKPGQDWNLEIQAAVRSVDVVIVCLSRHAVTKEGYVQKELRLALDVAEEKPDGTIFLIPLNLRSAVFRSG